MSTFLDIHENEVNDTLNTDSTESKGLSTQHDDCENGKEIENANEDQNESGNENESENGSEIIISFEKSMEHLPDTNPEIKTESSTEIQAQIKAENRTEISTEKIVFDEDSLPYLAPEILNGNICDSKKADIWSLGIILFTMTSGFFPFGGELNGKNGQKNAKNENENKNGNKNKNEEESNNENKSKNDNGSENKNENVDENNLEKSSYVYNLFQHLEEDTGNSREEIKNKILFCNKKPYPDWLSNSLKLLLNGILVDDPYVRSSLFEIKNSEWLTATTDTTATEIFLENLRDKIKREKINSERYRVKKIQKVNDNFNFLNFFDCVCDPMGAFKNAKKSISDKNIYSSDSCDYENEIENGNEGVNGNKNSSVNKSSLVTSFSTNIFQIY